MKFQGTTLGFENLLSFNLIQQFVLVFISHASVSQVMDVLIFTFLPYNVHFWLIKIVSLSESIKTRYDLFVDLIVFTSFKCVTIGCSTTTKKEFWMFIPSQTFII